MNGCVLGEYIVNATISLDVLKKTLKQMLVKFTGGIN